MNPANKAFLFRAFRAAKAAGHIFPELAACEAALESSYGQSQLAARDNNLFGMKQHLHPIYGTHVLPTREFLRGGWVTINASWIVYPDWETCFQDRMRTLRRLAPTFPHYAAALAAESGTSYVNEVSRSWSTDPKRAEKVLAIYEACAGDWSATQNA